MEVSFNVGHVLLRTGSKWSRISHPQLTAEHRPVENARLEGVLRQKMRAAPDAAAGVTELRVTAAELEQIGDGTYGEMQYVSVQAGADVDAACGPGEPVLFEPCVDSISVRAFRELVKVLGHVRSYAQAEEEAQDDTFWASYAELFYVVVADRSTAISVFRQANAYPRGARDVRHELELALSSPFTMSSAQPLEVCRAAAIATSPFDVYVYIERKGVEYEMECMQPEHVIFVPIDEPSHLSGIPLPAAHRVHVCAAQLLRARVVCFVVRRQPVVEEEGGGTLVYGVEMNAYFADAAPECMLKYVGVLRQWIEREIAPWNVTPTTPPEIHLFLHKKHKNATPPKARRALESLGVCGVYMLHDDDHVVVDKYGIYEASRPFVKFGPCDATYATTRVTTRVMATRDAYEFRHGDRAWRIAKGAKHRAATVAVAAPFSAKCVYLI